MVTDPPTHKHTHRQDRLQYTQPQLASTQCRPNCIVYIVYETRDVVLYPLFLIFNQSFKTGVLPYDWKLAEVTAVHKQEAQLMLTTGSTRLAVSRGQQTWYHSTCYI